MVMPMPHAVKTRRILLVDADEKNYWCLKQWSEKWAHITAHDPGSIQYEFEWRHNVRSAMTFLLQPPRFNGVITDLFLPYCDDVPSFQPCGIAVIHECKRLNIPCVICTPYHHENEQLDWLRHTGLLAGASALVGMSDEYIRERYLAEHASETTQAERSEFAKRIQQEQMPTKDIPEARKQLIRAIRAKTC